MSGEYSLYFVVVFFFFFGVMWICITNVLRNDSKLSKVIEADVGDHFYTTKWGTGNVNGVSMRNSLRVVAYTEGFVLETQKKFGGGKLWLPKNNIVLSRVTKKSLLKPKKLELISENNRIALFGELADAIVI